jgi:hypothetical protein
VTIPDSDDETNYPVLFQILELVDLYKREHGTREDRISPKNRKEALKETDP